MLRIFLVFVITICTVGSVAPVCAQDGKVAASENTVVGGAPSQAIQNETAAALEELRYKHLWIAYALIWLTVFLFMYRTYRIGHENRDRIDGLKQRLAELESQDG